jgi:multidrug resistance efflux pump
MIRALAVLYGFVVLSGCGAKPPVQTVSAAASSPNPSPAGVLKRQVRATGTVKAVRQFTVLVPQISGQMGGRLTLTRIIPSGATVAPGDVLAEFDRTQQADNARDAQAKFDDLTHQIDQKKAENRSNTETRSADLQQALANLEKAKLQLRKAELLGQIERLQNETRAEAAIAKLGSLKKSHQFREQADAAALRILELKRDRLAVALKRAETNVTRLLVRAPLGGMVALEPVYRGESRGPAQEGDQVYPGQPLLRVFDPGEMEVHTSVGEPDGAVLVAGSRALVRLDAYPELIFSARFLSASPVAASDLGSPIKRFAARFLLEKSDPHLLPDLSAAVIIQGEEKP